ncbi:cold-shock protein [Pedobacter miscanthi]|jgi:CspA family cold shock protein|uniref:cold-shock protein n=1 Tax=Pedobacter miscanthi TaxID=2259170 RepID=UPI00292D4E7C|nr:cold-shock protein [Pedobacter miscanthi]
MRLGTVKFYNSEEGFGGITPSNGGMEFNVFAHGIIGEIKPDNIVQFDLEFTKSGVEAVQVRILSA